MTTRTHHDMRHDIDVEEEKHVLPVAGGYALGAMRIAFGFYFLWAFVDKFVRPGLRDALREGLAQRRLPDHRLPVRSRGPPGGLLQRPGRQHLHRLAVHARPARHRSHAGHRHGARVGALAGALMYLFMYGASLPTVTNPFLDDHLTGAIVMIVIATVPAAWDYLGLGKFWAHIAPSWLR